MHILIAVFRLLLVASGARLKISCISLDTETLITVVHTVSQLRRKMADFQFRFWDVKFCLILSLLVAINKCGMSSLKFWQVKFFSDDIK